MQQEDAINGQLRPHFILHPYAQPRSSGMMNYPTESPYADDLRTKYNSLVFQNHQNHSVDQNFILNLESNLPSILNMQSNDNYPPPKKGEFNQNPSIFLSEITDSPQTPLIQLTPVPNLDLLTLDEIIQTAIEQQVPSQRMAWVIHNFLYKRNMAHDVIRQETFRPFMEKYSKNESQAHKFIQLCYSLFTKNLLEHLPFLIDLVSLFSPKHYFLFKNEIFRSFTLLDKCLNNQQGLAFHRKLLSSKPQLVQLASYYYTTKNKKFEIVKNMMTPDLIRRVSKVVRYMDEVEPLHRLVLQLYPYDDPSIFRREVMKQKLFLSNRDEGNFIIQLCSSVLWLKESNTTLAITISHIIQDIINASSTQFPLKDYINLLLENPEKSEITSELSAFLQYDNIFKYEDFLENLKNFEDTNYIFLNTPCLSRNDKTLNEISANMMRICQEEDYQFYEEILQQAFKDFSQLTIDDIMQLPIVYRYSVCLWICCEKSDFSYINLLLNLKIKSLALMMIEKHDNTFFAKENKERLKSQEKADLPPPPPQRGRPPTKKPEPKPTATIKIPQYTNVNYKTKMTLLPLLKMDPSKYSETINYLSNLNYDELDFDYNLVHKFFNEHSFFCSLNTYDSLMSVTSENDFRYIMIHFMKDLLSFEGLSSDDLSAFLWDLSISNLCLKNADGTFQSARDYTMTLFLNTLLQDETLSLSKHTKEIIKPLLEKLFEWKLLTPSFFISKIVEVSNMVYTLLINTLFSLMEEKPHLFVKGEFLFERFIKSILILDSEELNQFVDLISKLEPTVMPHDAEQAISNVSNEVDNKGNATCASIIFSTLPLELLNADISDSFNYIIEHLSWETMTIFCKWLCFKPYYSLQQRILVQTMVKESDLERNNNEVVSCFLNYMSGFESPDSFHLPRSSRFIDKEEQIDEEQNKRELICYAWKIVCDEESITKAAAEKIKEYIYSSSFRPFPLFTNFVIPVLSKSTETGRERLVNALIGPEPPDDCHERPLATILYCMMLFVKLRPERTPKDNIITGVIKIFKYIEKLKPSWNYDTDLTFFSDGINYMIASLSNQQTLAFDVEEAIKKYFRSDVVQCPLPKSFQNNIILNQPPQYIKWNTPISPLYIDETNEIAQQPVDQQQFGNPYEPDPTYQDADEVLDDLFF